MIERMKNMKRVFVVSSLLLVISFTAMAQVFGATQGEEQPAFGASAPSATFQSTSIMSGSGSEYSANPTIGADGSAAYDASYSPANSAKRIGNVRTTPPNPGGGGSGSNTPLGDAVVPLMLLLCAYAGYKKVRAHAFG